MNHSGVDGPDKLQNSEWERCPDWNGRPVIRFSHKKIPWIFWQGSDRFLDEVSSSQDLRGRSWYRAALEEASQVPTEIQFFLDDREDQAEFAWLGVELRAFQSVDCLVDRFGRPPLEVRRDWHSQRDGASLTATSSDLLSHFLVTVEGQLFSLWSLETIILVHLSNNSAHPTRDLDIPIPDKRCLRDAPRAPIAASGSLDELLKGEEIKIESIAKPDAPNATLIIPEGLLDRKPLFRANVHAKSTLDGVRSADRPSRRLRNPKTFYAYVGAGAALLVAILGIGAWINRPALQVVQLDPGTPTKIDSKSEGESFLAMELEHQEPPATLELSGDLHSLPENSLESQASSSLESLMWQITGGKPPVSIDSISFESVAEALNQTSDEAIVQESLAEAGSKNPIEHSQATRPFGESLDEAATQELMQETAGAMTSSSESTAENLNAPSFVSDSLTIRQAQYKTKIRVPFSTNDRKAVCRVKLEIADDLLLKPAEAIELVGRQDAVWTIAFNDDNVHLNFYLRSIPSKSWYIATAVRLKQGNGSEIPIGRNDATQVCLRLQNYLRWLDQSRQVGESMRSNRKTRSMAITGLEQIEKQTKSTEKSLKNWLAIEKLVLAFYEEISIELELATASEMLPGS